MQPSKRHGTKCVCSQCSNTRRTAEVAREFARIQQYRANNPDDYPPSEHAQYMAPWRQRFTGHDIAKIPWHGPQNAQTYEDELNEYNESTAGGGLWDPEEAERMTGRTAANKVKAAERFDAEKMRRYVERHSADIALRKLEIYVEFYVNGLGKGAVAKKIGISANAVKVLLFELRSEMRTKSRTTPGS